MVAGMISLRSLSFVLILSKKPVGRLWKTPNPKRWSRIGTMNLSARVGVPPIPFLGPRLAVPPGS
jgi:hypothetical protein